MRALFPALLLLFLPFAAPAQAPEDLLLPDPTRGILWGMSFEEVKNAETGTYVEAYEKDHLFYMDEITLAEDKVYKALIEYDFDDKDRLYAVRYDIVPNTHQPHKLFDNMMDIQHWMDTVFGQASEPSFFFYHDRDRNDPQQWGWAVIRGDATVKVQWARAKTKALLTLSGGNYKGDLTLVLERAASPAIP